MTFPKLMKCERTGLTVLATREVAQGFFEGTVVEVDDEGHHPLGVTANNWNEKSFTEVNYLPHLLEHYSKEYL